MSKALTSEFVYKNLTYLCNFNESTSLCIYEPQHKLYVAKQVNIECRQYFETIAAIDNPHLAHIEYIAESGGVLTILYEYISGKSLSELMKSEKTLSKERAVRIAYEVCDGVAALHKAGIVHRDINPNNIIISTDNVTKIIDFGIARSFLQEKSSDTEILGTKGYAAPEQFGFTQSDARTDIYAVGVLLNVMCTGQLPSQAVADGTLGKKVKKCIEIDPKKRYSSVFDLQRELGTVADCPNCLDRFYKKIPGLRNRHAVVVVLASVGYLFVTVLSAFAFTTAYEKEGMPGVLAELFSWLFSVAVPFCCFHNFLGIWDVLPFSKGASKRSQRISYILIGIASVFMGISLFNTIN